MRFSDQLALVTGAGQGIGRATADLLLEQGATVLYTDRDAGLLATVPASERTLTLTLDVTSEADWHAAAARITERFGHLDILVNNAGIDMMCPLETIALDAWRGLMAINVDGTFLGVRTMLPLLLAAKDRRPGGASVVNFSSIMGQSGMADVSAYCASKGAVTVFTKALSAELAPKGVRVNSVHPGMITGPMMEAGARRAVAAGRVPDAETFVAFLNAAAPMGRAGEPHEVAAAVAFLASSEASFVSGCELNVDGGYNAS